MPSLCDHRTTHEIMNVLDDYPAIEAPMPRHGRTVQPHRPIEREFASPDCRHRAFLLPARMNAREPVPQLRLIKLVLGLVALEPGPGLGDAILHGFHGVAARQRPPGSCPVGLQDDVRVYRHGAARPNHDASWLGRFRDAVHREQIRKSVDAQFEPCRGPAHRDQALPDREPENLQERLREQGGGTFSASSRPL